MNIIPFLLFPAFFVPTLIMVRDAFSDDEFKYAGYAIALVSAVTTTLLLSNPVGFLSLVMSAGIFPTIMVFLFAGFCLIPLGTFMIIVFVGLKERFRLHNITIGLDHEIPEIQANQQRIPEVSRERRNDLGISDVGRQQIARLVRAQKDDEGENDESGYIFISSDSDD